MPANEWKWKNADSTRRCTTIPPKNWKPGRAADAFNLGFPSIQAMDEEINKHPEVFKEISTLATKKAISYEDAEKELRKVDDPNLISKIKNIRIQTNPNSHIQKNRSLLKFM